MVFESASPAITLINKNREGACRRECDEQNKSKRNRTAPDF